MLGKYSNLTTTLSKPNKVLECEFRTSNLELRISVQGYDSEIYLQTLRASGQPNVDNHSVSVYHELIQPIVITMKLNTVVVQQ